MNTADEEAVLAIARSSEEAPHWTRRDYEQVLLPAPFPGPALLRCGLVALKDETVVGFAVASWVAQEPVAEVECLVVDPSCRRLGIGSALIEACLAWAGNTGAKQVRLEVRVSNTAAIALYQRQGFSAAGVRRAYYTAPEEDALLLQAPVPL